MGFRIECECGRQFAAPEKFAGKNSPVSGLWTRDACPGR